MFYEKVVDYCKKKSISISSFEQLCEIGNGTVGRWKDNKSLPSMTTLKKIEKATKIPIKKWIE